jgi:hypothetical protein
MLKTFSLIGGCAVLTVTLVLAGPVHAQATRTWVSGVGDDVNPCSRTAPCKTFAGAISKTAAGGEINCLDAGGFGAVTITKALTIACLYTEGGTLAGGNGIVVNAGAQDAVYLKGLDIFGANPPTNGVRFIAGGSLHIEDSIIRRFNASNSYGISIAPTTKAKIYILRTVIADNGSAGSGGGIRVEPQSEGQAVVFIMDSTISNNAGPGIAAVGTATRVAVSNTRVLGNSTGIAAASGGKVLSYGDNIVAGNAADGSFQGTLNKN